MKKKKILIYTSLPVVGVSLLSAGIVSAHGLFPGKILSPEDIATRQAAMFEHQATMLGVDVNVIKNGWAEGKTLPEIAESQGISRETLEAKMKSEHETQLKNQLQSLVVKGVISQAQADKRLQFMMNRASSKGLIGRKLFIK